MALGHQRVALAVLFGSLLVAMPTLIFSFLPEVAENRWPFLDGCVHLLLAFFLALSISDQSFSFWFFQVFNGIALVEWCRRFFLDGLAYGDLASAIYAYGGAGLLIAAAFFRYRFYCHWLSTQGAGQASATGKAQPTDTTPPT
jgi:hypothetical protein